MLIAFYHPKSQIAIPEGGIFGVTARKTGEAEISAGGGEGGSKMKPRPETASCRVDMSIVEFEIGSDDFALSTECSAG
jgi:hypothetical protein